jgi:C4-type Zn-finger protein
MAGKSRIVPHVCPKCGKQSVETGIPVLTENGLKDTFVRPHEWIVFHGDFICDECAFRSADEIDEENAQSLAEMLREHIRRGYDSVKMKVVGRAVTILFENKNDWLEHWDQQDPGEEG